MTETGHNPTETEQHKSNFKMINIGGKRPTKRRAVACGAITMNEAAFAAAQSGRLPKGDVVALAEAAGIMAAKKVADMIPMCHNLPLEEARIYCEFDALSHSITVYGQAAAFAKTGVEMEALAAVNAALLTFWDMIKGTDPNLSLGGIRLLLKQGGKSGLWLNPGGIPAWLRAQLPDLAPLKGKKAAILTISDRAARGDYADETGPELQNLLAAAGAEISACAIIADEAALIEKALLAACSPAQPGGRPDIIIAAGGTGPGPRDVTPEALHKICDKMLDGLGELLRRESLYYTDTAWLSRMSAGMAGGTLILALPGSPKAVRECWEILVPFLGAALDRIRKQGFEEK